MIMVIIIIVIVVVIIVIIIIIIIIIRVIENELKICIQILPEDNTPTLAHYLKATCCSVFGCCLLGL
jgi:hypothetical protein